MVREIIMGIWALSSILFIPVTNQQTEETNKGSLLLMKMYLYSTILTGLMMIGLKKAVIVSELSNNLPNSLLIAAVFLTYGILLFFIRGIGFLEEPTSNSMYVALKRVLFAWIHLPVVLFLFNHDVMLTFQITFFQLVSLAVVTIAIGIALSKLKKEENVVQTVKEE